MEKQLEDIFLQDGYRFWKAKEQPDGVFYKYYEEGFHLVMVLEETGEKVMLAEQLKHMQERVQEIFYHPQGRLADFPDGFPVYHVELLTLFVTDQTEKVRHFCMECEPVWLMEKQNNRLIIYENQPGDFWGLRQKLERLERKTETQSGSWKNAVDSQRSSMKKAAEMPVVTSMIALVNVVVYLLLSVHGATESGVYMASHGAMYPDFILYNHQWWRFFTAMFLHFGIKHLMNNMVILYCVGSRLEKVIGTWKMLFVYMASGIGGGLLSYAMMLWTGDYAVSAGASGAVFGIIGGLLWAVIWHKGNVEGLTTSGLLVMLLLSLYFGYSTAGVDNWCHIGGLICGFLMTALVHHNVHAR